MADGKNILDAAETGRDAAEQARLRAQMAELMQARGESLAEFGAVLAHTMDPQRRPFSRQYMNGVLKGQRGFTISLEMASAMNTLLAMLDGVGELQARARTVVVPLLAMHLLPAHAIIMGKARPCALAGCRIQFVPASPAQRFCSLECRVEYHRRALLAATSGGPGGIRKAGVK